MYSSDEKFLALVLAEALGNVAAACRQMGMSRSTFYALRRAYAARGRSGLEPTPRRPPRMPNAFTEEAVRGILEMTERFPSYSCARISAKLRAVGVNASASGVRKVWKRNGLTKREERVGRFAVHASRAHKILLTQVT